MEHTAELGGTATLGNISSFGVDAAGELYVASFSGKILRIVGPAVTPRVVWRNKVTGQNIAWLMNGTSIVSAVFLPAIANLDRDIAGLGDLSGDGRADLVWRNKSTGQNVMWLMDGFVQTPATLPTIADVNWEIGSP